MIRTPYVAILLVLLSLWACEPATNELVEQLNKVVVPLPEGSPLTYGNAYLGNLVPWDSFALVGMGEATHGTMDFVELRQRLFQYLAEELHCRTLAYEYSYRKSLLVNDYIHFRHDCLDTLFSGDLWIQDNETLRQFIQWMREFNRNRGPSDRLNFIGIDNQVDAIQLPDVLNQIRTYAPDFEFEMERFPYNVPGREVRKYDEMDPGEYNKLSTAFRDLEREAESYAISLTETGEQTKAEVALNLIRALIGSHKFLYTYYAEGVNIRDRQMAENTLRLIASSVGEGPVALWAHNAHVAVNPHYSQDGSPAMGWYLRNALKQEYLSLATSFSLGKFTAVMYDSAGNDTPPLTCEISEEPPPASLNALFHRTSVPQFFLHMRDLDPEGSLYAYLDSDRPMIGIGDLYLGSPELHFTHDRVINVLQAHDLLFYFRDTRPLIVK